MPPDSSATSVLAVDDESIVLEVLRSALEDGGFRVQIAVTGDAAIDVLSQAGAKNVAVLVTDVSLGAGPNGWDVAKRGRELNPALAVVYVSGDGANEWAALGVPRSLFIHKPFAPAQLVTAVATLLNDIQAIPPKP
jgi:CheY-like chemotaxis protein